MGQFDFKLIEMSKTPNKMQTPNKAEKPKGVVSKKENTKTNLAAKTTKPRKNIVKKLSVAFCGF